MHSPLGVGVSYLSRKNYFKISDTVTICEALSSCFLGLYFVVSSIWERIECFVEEDLDGQRVKFYVIGHFELQLGGGIISHKFSGFGRMNFCSGCDILNELIFATRRVEQIAGTNWNFKNFHCMRQKFMHPSCSIYYQSVPRLEFSLTFYKLTNRIYCI